MAAMINSDPLMDDRVGVPSSGHRQAIGKSHAQLSRRTLVRFRKGVARPDGTYLAVDRRLGLGSSRGELRTASLLSRAKLAAAVGRVHRWAREVEAETEPVDPACSGPAPIGPGQKAHAAITTSQIRPIIGLLEQIPETEQVASEVLAGTPDIEICPPSLDWEVEVRVAAAPRSGAGPAGRRSLMPGGSPNSATILITTPIPEPARTTSERTPPPVPQGRKAVVLSRYAVPTTPSTNGCSVP